MKKLPNYLSMFLTSLLIHFRLNGVLKYNTAKKGERGLNNFTHDYHLNESWFDSIIQDDLGFRTQIHVNRENEKVKKVNTFRKISQ